MACCVAQCLLHSGENQLGNSWGNHIVDPCCNFIGDIPHNFIKRLLEVLFDHRSDGMDHAITLQPVRSAGRCGAHHGSQMTMGMGDRLNCFIEGWLDLLTEALIWLLTPSKR